MRESPDAASPQSFLEAPQGILVNLASPAFVNLEHRANLAQAVFAGITQPNDCTVFVRKPADFLVKYFGWRAAFVVPGVVAIACGIVFARVAPHEATPPSRRAPRELDLPPGVIARALLVVTLTSTCASLIFNFTTNGNGEFLRERMAEITRDPALLGALLAAVYVIASFAQVIVGRAIDRYPLKRLYFAIVLVQIPLFLLATHAEGWTLYTLAVVYMAFVFGAIPFTDAIVVRYVDDRMRSRVAGIRLTVSFGIASLAVYLLGPLVKAAGFTTLLLILAAISTATAAAVLLLPVERRGASPD